MQTQLDASYASVRDGDEWKASHHNHLTHEKALRTYWMRGWRSPSADLDADEKKTLSCCKESNTCTTFSRPGTQSLHNRNCPDSKLLPHKAFLPWRMSYVLSPYLFLPTAFSQRIYINIWYWHSMLKFVVAGLLVGALEYVRRACEIVVSVHIFQYNKWRTA